MDGEVFPSASACELFARCSFFCLWWLVFSLLSCPFPSPTAFRGLPLFCWNDAPQGDDFILESPLNNPWFMRELSISLSPRLLLWSLSFFTSSPETRSSFPHRDRFVVLFSRGFIPMAARVELPHFPPPPLHELIKIRIPILSDRAGTPFS